MMQRLQVVYFSKWICLHWRPHQELVGCRPATCNQLQHRGVKTQCSWERQDLIKLRLLSCIHIIHIVHSFQLQHADEQRMRYERKDLMVVKQQSWLVIDYWNSLLIITMQGPPSGARDVPHTEINKNIKTKWGPKAFFFFYQCGPFVTLGEVERGGCQRGFIDRQPSCTFKSYCLFIIKQTKR